MRTVAPEHAFLDTPIEADLDLVNARVAILGVPHGRRYPEPGATVGCADAPRAIRERSQRLASFRGHWDFDLDGPLDVDGVVDVGDVPGHPDHGDENAERTTAAVAALLDRRAVPICLGGDDSVPIPILRAYRGRGPITVLHVDAHLDFRDEVQGVRDGYSSPMRRASEMSHVRRIVQVGLRGAGSARAGDVADARAAGNLLVPAAELHERGLAWLLDCLAGDDQIFLAFDCDAMDPSLLPAVSAPAPGGLAYEETSALLEAVAPSLVGAAFTEFVPSLDADGLSALVVTRLVTTLLAGRSRTRP
jgi:agmatinase